MLKKLLLPASALVALFLIFAAVPLWLAPDVAARAFGLPSDTDAWPRVAGTREAALGLVLLVLAFKRERRALGLALIACSAVAAGDFVLVWMQGVWRVEMVPHILGVPGLIVLGSLLLNEEGEAQKR